MKQVRIVKSKPTERRDIELEELRTPSGRLLPF